MSQHQKALRLADELMQTHKGHADEGPTSFSEAAHELRAQQARIADLEAQLYAISSGGVGASIQPLPADTYTALAHRIATKYAHRSDPAFCGYAFLPNTLEQFVRAIEQAHGITGGQ